MYANDLALGLDQCSDLVYRSILLITEGVCMLSLLLAGVVVCLLTLLLCLGCLAGGVSSASEALPSSSTVNY